MFWNCFEGAFIYWEHSFFIVWFLCVASSAHSKGICIHLFNPLKHDWRSKKDAHRSKAAWRWQKSKTRSAQFKMTSQLFIMHTHVCVCCSSLYLSFAHNSNRATPTHASALFTLRLNQLSSFVAEQNRLGCLLAWSVHPLSCCSR